MVPVQAEYYALEGFSMLMNSIKMIQKRINRNLKIFGVAMTMVDARSKLSRHVCTEVSRKIPNKVFNTTIRRLVKVAEAPWSGAPTVLLNEPRASGAVQVHLNTGPWPKNFIIESKRCAENLVSKSIQNCSRIVDKGLKINLSTIKPRGWVK